MSRERAPILSLLEALPRAKAHPNGQWQARCPAHEDSAPSLSWTVVDDGRVLLHCFASCDAEAVVAALGVTMADLFPPKREPRPPARPTRVIRTTDHAIRDAAGLLIATHRRRDRADGSKTFSWLGADGQPGLGDMPVTSLLLYGTERLPEWPAAQGVVVTEGEKAADALLRAGAHALATVTGAGPIPDATVLGVLAGRPVVLWPDADVAGFSHMQRLARRLAPIATEVRWLAPPDDAPRGWDAADALEDATDPGAVLKSVAERIIEVPDGTDRTDETPGGDGSGRSVPPGAWSEWPEVEPLTADAPLPSFPVGLLPPWMADMVLAVAANTETDVSMAAVTALGLASVPLSNRYPVTTSAWTERGCNLFVVSVAESGELKSAVFAALDAPLREHEQEVLDAEAPVRRSAAAGRKEVETRLGVAKDELKRAMRTEVTARAKAADGGPEEKVDEALRAIEGARNQLRATERELEDDTERQLPAYALLADDSTPEALQRQMAQQDGRAGMVSAESELFLMAAGRYSDRGPSLQVYLSGFSGEPMRV